MDSKNYEELVSKLTKSIYEIVERTVPIEVKHGFNNQWQGVSGYSHQIDVSVVGPNDLILAECKFWNKRVPIEAVLAFHSRVLDIQPTFQGQTHGILASTVGFQSGAEKYAAYYHIDLRVVQSEYELVVAFKDHILLGSHDSAKFGETAKLERSCAVCRRDQVLGSDGCSYVCQYCDL